MEKNKIAHDESVKEILRLLKLDSAKINTMRDNAIKNYNSGGELRFDTLIKVKMSEVILFYKYSDNQISNAIAELISNCYPEAKYNINTYKISGSFKTNLSISIYILFNE